MSPEQTKAELAKISPQTDIWALGIIAHRLLTGTEPWDAPTLTALISQIAFQPLPVPSERGYALGPGFDAWFARCCAREPEDRFPTAGLAIAQLGLALGVAEDSQRASIPLAVPRTIVRPPREETSRTAFSATAPAPPAATASTAPPDVPLRPPSSSRRMILGVGMTVVLGAFGILAYASSRPPVPAAIVPAESTAMSAAVATATPVTVVTPSSAAPIETAAPSASAAPDPRRAPPPVRATPEPSASAHRATLPPPPRPPSPPPPPPVTAPPAPPSPPPAPTNPLGSRH
jgi:serine/threonine-protein kinase